MNKYALYEESVQTPEHHIKMFVEIYRELNKGRYARKLREDFCGTFQLSREWVARNRKNSAIGLDLDPEPLAYGKKHHFSKLTRDQKARLKPLRQNVLSVTSPRSDLVIACNFSFCIFQKRSELLQYFRMARRSLAKNGAFIVDIAGGPGMIEPTRERMPKYDKKGKRKYTYVWHQKSFDPITHRAKYAIHFEFPSGRKMRDAFTYDWRLWTVPEITEVMTEAGFDEVHVYWETEHKGRGTGEYVRMTEGTNDYAWIAYIVGVVR